MARYTIREFAKALGVEGKSPEVKAWTILDVLCSLGIASVAGKQKKGTGRPLLLYEVPDQFVINLNTEDDEDEAQEEPVVQEVVEDREPVAVEQTLPQPPTGNFFYDEDDED